MILTARDLRSGAIVAGLASGFGVALLQGTWVLVDSLGTHDVASHARMQVALTVVAGVLFAIAVFVGAIVTSNTVRTVIAGRTLDIARLRLLGASANSIRTRILRSGLIASSLGSIGGGVIICVVGAGLVPIAVQASLLPEAPYALLRWLLLVPVAVTMMTCVTAVWNGSRTVLEISPIEATGHAAVHSGSTSRVTTIVGTGMLALGAALLAGGIVVGQETSLGLLVAVLGGMVSFTGIILLAEKVLPSVLRGVGMLFSVGPASRLAAANAVREPGRSSRATIGVVIGVTLIVMFSVAMETYQDVLFGAQSEFPELYRGTESALTMSIGIFSVLFGFSAIIAAVGLVNTLSLSVLQRRRELGLLRAIGLSRRQVRTMITVESLTMGSAAVVVGVVLGVGYGWSGAMALLGSIPGGRFVSPVIPPALIVAVAASGVVLTLIAAAVPVRRVLLSSAVAALAAE